MSVEQQKIVRKLKDGNNILVNAVPGSGKTTTIIEIVENIRVRTLCMTFSKRLQIESEKRLPTNIRNCKFLTIHGASFYYYGCSIEVLDDHKRIARNINLELIILDESQDIGFMHYYLIKKLMSDNICQNCKFVILGDSKQTIFNSFQKVSSDSRFLTLADEIYHNSNDWISLPLSESFRLSQENCRFINRVVLNSDGDLIRSNKQGYKPRFVITNGERRNQDIYSEILYYLRMGYEISDIFILCATIVKFGQNTDLMDELSRRGFLIYHTDEDNKYSEECSYGKMNFLTYHSSKGLENKVIIIVGFDSSYYYCFDKDDRKKCPNLIYVAISRVKERLSLIRCVEHSHLPFINVSKIETFAEIINKHNLAEPAMYSRYVRVKPRDITVTELLKKSRTSTIKEILNSVRIEEQTPIDVKIEIPEKILMRGTQTYEYVADFSGIGIISYYEYLKSGKMKIKPDILPEDFTIENVLKYSIEFSTKSSEIFYRQRQVLYTNWIDEEKINQCMDRLNFLDGNAVFEEEFCREVNCRGDKYLLTGICDYIDYENRIIVEFKCKNMLADEDFVQVLLYAYLNKQNFRIYVFNVITNQRVKIHYDYDRLHYFVVRLLDEMDEIEQYPDEDFIERCLTI